MVNSETKMMLLGGAVALAAILLYVKKNGGIAGAAAGVGTAAADAVIGFGGGVVSGAAYGIGDAIGVPRTDQTECEKAKAEGRTWDASFACPASDFLKYMTS